MTSTKTQNSNIQIDYSRDNATTEAYETERAGP